VTAVVTGGSSGIGRAIALALAEQGVDVAVVARSREELDFTVAAIEAKGSGAVGLELDVTDTAKISSIFDDAEAALGPIDVLVNSAGLQRLNGVLDVTSGEWDEILDTNLRGSFFCCQDAARRMAPRGRGNIVNIASLAGLHPWPGRVAYAASKAGLIMVTRVLALELAPFGIRVNAVAPTFVDTPLGRQTIGDPKARDEVIARIPLGRLATVEDVLGAVRYLTSNESAFVTGAVMSVDGGLGMR